MLLITHVAWSGVELLQSPSITNIGAYPNGSELNREKLINACSGSDYDRLWLYVWRCSYYYDTLLNPLTLILLMWRIGWANSITIYIQQDAMSHSLFISGNCSTCFGWYFHPLSGVHTTVSTGSGICHTVTAICRYRGRFGTGLSVLWVAYATHSTLKPVPTLPW
jgi:hypothetical protein